MRNWKVIAGVVGVFVLGMVAGALMTVRHIHKRAQEAFTSGSPRAAEFVARRLDWELRLDADQRRQVLAVMQNTQREMQAAYVQVRPQVATILADSSQKIRALLRPDQKVKYDRIVAARRARWLSGARTPGELRGPNLPTSPPAVPAKIP